jgi:hypothetical protein
MTSHTMTELVRIMPIIRTVSCTIRYKGILTANANWPAGGATALFAAGRSNLGTAGNLAVGTFAELRALLTKQTSPARAGESAAPLPPPSSMVLLVGPDEEDTALELLGNRIVPTATGAVLPDAYRSSTSLVMEPFLDTGNDPYYLCRGDIRGVEIAYLQGQRAPTITSAEDIRYSGMTFRVVFDFGAVVFSWRPQDLVRSAFPQQADTPAAARRRAMPAPMPDPPPVTYATRPSRSFMARVSPLEFLGVGSAVGDPSG